MQRFIFKSIIATVAAVFVFSHQSSAAATADPQDKFPRIGLNEPVGRMRGVSLTSASSYEVAYYIMSRSRLPVGFEEKAGEEKRYEKKYPLVRHNYSLEDLTLRGALDLLKRNDPLYNWNSSNGVINILPVKGSILDIRIPRFMAQNSDIYTAIESLAQQIDQPEYRQAVFGSSRKRANDFYVRSGPRLNIRLTNPSLRDCLNELIKQDGHHDWQLHYLKEGSSPRFEIYFHLRNSGIADANKITRERSMKTREEKLLREGFKKTKGGAWVKPGPVAPIPDQTMPGQKDIK